MSTNRWLGGAQPVARVETYTVGSATVGQTFGVTINAKPVYYTAVTGDTTATVATGLQAALAGSALPEFKRVTWSVSTLDVIGTATTAGVPFIGAVYGTGTLSRAVTTAGTGPNDVANTANWSLGAVPAVTDAVVIDGTDSGLLWNLDTFNAAGILASFTVKASFTGTIGLPEITADGYREYLPRYLKFADGVTAVSLGDGEGTGSSRLLLDFDAYTPTVSVVATGVRVDTALPPLIMTGLAAGAVVNVAGGELGVAAETGQTATVTTLRVAEADTKVLLGSGATVVTIDQDDGSLEVYGAVTTLGITGGQYAQHAGTLTTATADGGTVILRQGGTVTTATFRGQSSTNPPTCDLSYDPRPITFTNHSFTGGAVLRDPNHDLTVTNSGTWDRASIQASDFGARVSLSWT